MIQGLGQQGQVDEPGSSKRDGRDPVTPAPVDVFGCETTYNGSNVRSIGDAVAVSMSGYIDRVIVGSN